MQIQERLGLLCSLGMFFKNILFVDGIMSETWDTKDQTLYKNEPNFRQYGVVASTRSSERVDYQSQVASTSFASPSRSFLPLSSNPISVAPSGPSPLHSPHSKLSVEEWTGGFELVQWSLARLETQKRGGELGDAAKKMIFPVILESRLAVLWSRKKVSEVVGIRSAASQGWIWLALSVSGELNRPLVACCASLEEVGGVRFVLLIL